MQGTLHKVEISGGYATAKVLIDGQEIHRLSGYTIERNAGEIPLVELRIVCPGETVLEAQAEVVVENSETMAKLFDRKQFDEFCRLWEEYHAETDNSMVV